MPIEQMSKVSRTIVPSLKRLGICTVRDLLMHLPSRYEDFSHIKKIRDVSSQDVVTVQGIIRSISRFRTKQSGTMLIQAVLGDETGIIKATWFNQPYLFRNLAVGDTVNFAGKAELRSHGIELQNPSYEKISSRAQTPFSPLHTGKLVPVYPETRGLTSRWLRYLISSSFAACSQIADPLPSDVRQEYDLLELSRALHAIHFPRNVDEISFALRRFQFEDLFFIQLYSLRERMFLKQHRAFPIPANVMLIKKFVASLPFSLTDAQRRSFWEIMKDMEKPIPMNRLLEGDVGSGKTVVAAVAMLLAAHAGKRSCMLAPTEILARQHARSLEKLLAPFDIRVGLYTASEKRIPKKSHVFVGTHALLQKNIRITDLGLIVVDEQHRFGVQQRATLAMHHQMQERPHFLSMTATPIPRTLALTVYGDLDLSLLDEMPANRKAIITRVIDPAKRLGAYDFIRAEIKKHRQVFVVCPRIEANDDTTQYARGKKIQASLLWAEVKTVTEEYRKLSTEIFPDLRIAMLHGKLKAKEKSVIMQDFHDGRIDILVATSVIEVGVDVPNASVMMIEGAERFGLATLHQFRGRIGRGSEQSYCFLFPTQKGIAAGRLESLVKAKNGFELAEIDLRLRGPGDFLGTKQWGESPLFSQALMDPKMVRDVRASALDIIKKDSDFNQYPLIKQRLDFMQRMIHPE
ncbi:MAG: ATP-dependent DNA helicase RecG [Candidatus Sungbacteria bacterium]|nr:ATP-dependent DNA helicase RecG [bacterium]MDZ4260295.1 ATP-dependent DNA helicase RecG [Candidatus Sungbacteria bacterium]